MEKDNQGEIINGELTYGTIADSVRNIGSTIIGWTDGNGMHYDILFTRFPVMEGDIHGGIQSDYLFVSIMRVGAWAFRVNLSQSVHASYVEEKLGVPSEVAEKVAELINGVKEHL